MGDNGKEKSESEKSESKKLDPGITANPRWMFAQRSEDIIPDPPQSPEGEDLLHYLNQCMITQGPYAGERFGQRILPWQEKICRWIPHVDHIKIKAGKGSGKSYYFSALGLAHAQKWTNEGTHGRALIAIIAANIDTGKIIFNHLVHGIKADPFLNDGQWISNTTHRTMTHRDSGIVVQVLPPTLARVIGLRPAILMVDDFFAASAVAGWSEVYEQIKFGGMNWSDFKILEISTSPPDYPSAGYASWLNMARAVRDGKIRNDKLLPVLFEFPISERRDLDFQDPENWRFGMPSLIQTRTITKTKITKKGRVKKKTKTISTPGTMDVAQMQKEIDLAMKKLDLDGPEAVASLLSQRLGIEPSERESGITDLSDLWMNGITDGLPGPADTVAIGFDPGGMDDPFAAVAVHSYGDTWIAESRQWIMKRVLDKSPDFLQKIYKDAEKAGELSIVENHDVLEAQVFSYAMDRGNIGIPIFGGDAVGLDGFKENFSVSVGEYIEVSQGYKLVGAYRLALASLHSGRLKHLSNQPLLKFNADNLRIKGNRFLKADSLESGHNQGVRKIDGMMALFSSLSLLSSRPQVDVSSWIT